MARRTEPRTRVGVRELRQNLSVYLRRVERGESFEVTERGRPVAELRPRGTAPVSGLDQLIAEGRAVPARRSPASLAPPQAGRGRPLSEILREMRDEDHR